VTDDQFPAWRLQVAGAGATVAQKIISKTMVLFLAVYIKFFFVHREVSVDRFSFWEE